MIAEHLPVLQVVLPLVTAPLCVVLRNRKIALALTTIVCWMTTVTAGLLLRQTLSEGIVRYSLGNWEVPYGIEYRVDPLGAFVALLVALMGSLVITFAPASLEREIPQRQHYLFCAMYLLCLTGMLGIPLTGDIFNLFVFLEISSLSTYALISLGRSRQALMAAFQYLVMGTIGATFILIGIGLLLQMTGSLNLEDVAARLETQQGPRTVLVAFAFVSVGVSIKMALYPLHSWLPNSYAHAPSVVSAFVAATATKVSVYILLRFVFTLFKPQFAFDSLPLDRGLMALSLIGIVAASFAAVFQTSVKRLLAFSSIAQIGYMVLGISLADSSALGLTAGIVHLLNHALTKGGMFMAVGCFMWHLGTDRIADLQGVARRMPWTSFAWVIGGLGLIGVPMTAGFISKWYLLLAALEAGYWPVVIVLAIGSLLSIAYVWRVVEVLYFGESTGDDGPLSEAPLGMLIPTYVAIGASVLFGIWTPLSVGVAERAATMLLGVQP